MRTFVWKAWQFGFKSDDCKLQANTALDLPQGVKLVVSLFFLLFSDMFLKFAIFRLSFLQFPFFFFRSFRGVREYEFNVVVVSLTTYLAFKRSPFCVTEFISCFTFAMKRKQIKWVELLVKYRRVSMVSCLLTRNCFFLLVRTVVEGFFYFCFFWFFRIFWVILFQCQYMEVDRWLFRKSWSLNYAAER